jgi:HD-GYP domain-containing protein (c-di-GMP phosphodiesterase class II)
MLFNLNEFLMSVSFALDFIEIDILGVSSNHGKRTAYISLHLAKTLGLIDKELHDIVALAILHDNGVSEKALHDRFLKIDAINAKSMKRIKEHCIIGEDNIRMYPFLTTTTNVIKYHHENVDGTGYFGLKEDEIPIMSQIIHMADILEKNFRLENSNNDEIRSKTIEFINKQENKMFSPILISAFHHVAADNEFWENLKDDHIHDALKRDTPQYSVDLSFDKIREITGVFSSIIDSKSEYTHRHSRELTKKAAIMADYYKLDVDKKLKLEIAANLHDIGKLAVPNAILDSPSKLTDDEFEIIKQHPYFTRLALTEIKGFEDIAEWSSNHHEKLNGKGYPYGKTAKNLDFESRLIACLDVYEALTEERPYRRALEHEEAMEILYKMKEEGYIDANITEDIHYVFSQLK